MGTIHELPPRLVHDGVEYRITGRGVVARALDAARRWVTLDAEDVRAARLRAPVQAWLRENGWRER